MSKPNQLGVTAIKSLSVFIVGFITAMISQLADGFQKSDVFAIIPKALEAAGQAETFKQIGPEVKDGVTHSELAEIVAEVKAKFIEAKLGIENEPFFDELADAIADAAVANAKVYYVIAKYKTKAA